MTASYPMVIFSILPDISNVFREGETYLAIFLILFISILIAFPLSSWLYRRRFKHLINAVHRLSKHPGYSQLDSSSYPNEFHGIIKIIRQIAKEYKQARADFETLFANMPSAYSIKQAIRDEDGKIIDFEMLAVNPYFEKTLNRKAEDVVGKTLREIFPNLDQTIFENLKRVTETGEPQSFSHHSRTTERAYNVTIFRVENDKIATIFQDETERWGLQRQLDTQLQNMNALLEALTKITDTLDPVTMSQTITKICVEKLGVDLAWIGKAHKDYSVRLVSSFPPEHPYPKSIEVRWDNSSLGDGPSGRAIKMGEPQICEDITQDERFAPWRERAICRSLVTSAAFPLKNKGITFGVLNLYSSKPGFFSEKKDVFVTLAHLAAVALVNAKLHEDALRRLNLIESLRNIDMAITGSIDPRITLRVLLDEVIHHLKVDAASILLLDENSMELRHKASRGFRSRFIEDTCVRYGEGYAGRVASERKVVVCPDLRVAKDFIRAKMAVEEGFVSYYGAPMISKGKVLGVLETFHREMRKDEEEWIDALQSLASQAAIALENAELVSTLEQTNIALKMAYDETIEGWSRAMDMRDKETEGHTLRVTELTVRLARAMGISEDKIIHIKRGALLHDMGKLGVPDHILLKAGPLTDEEWKLMRLHPVFAFEMLYPIKYLRPAIAIPYCHHEKWDGTGYPRGLKGEEIPIEARLFAIVDVWDALTSDRPYRKAWQKDKVIELIKQESGKHFDPDVVNLFIKIME